MAGNCIPGAPLDDFEECNDGLDNTINDVCLDGVCSGVDPCIGKRCTALDQCHLPGVCIMGECTDPTRPNGTLCNDGFDTTRDDLCRAGVCVGTEKCQGVVCEAIDDCHLPGSCIATEGVCTTPARPDRSPCDDQLEHTSNDMCFDGECIGVDLCENVTCPSPPACKLPGTCFRGVCSFAAEDDGTPCSDAATDDDSCQAGTCVGIDYCANVTCPALSQVDFF